MKKVAISVHAIDNFSINLLKDLVGIDYIHVDVMDGKFVENKCLNLEIFKIIKNHFDLPIIAHLMVQEPSNYLDEIIDNIDYFLFHFEIKENKRDLIKKVRAKSKKVGVVLNPKTDISEIISILNDIDLVLILGVQPGWSGQSFIPKILNKINQLAKYKEKYNFLLDIDGGVTIQNAVNMKNADILTSSSAILNAKDPNHVIKLLKNIG